MKTFKEAREEAVKTANANGCHVKIYKKGEEYFTIGEGEITTGPAPGSFFIQTVAPNRFAAAVKYIISSWPTKDLRISTCKVDAETGKILRVRETEYRRTKAWWRARGFSFNGRLSARA